MSTERQKAFILAILDVWLPLLTRGEITPEEFRAFIEASLTF
mgnify:FL=1|jgi:hypothetical protein